MVAAAAVAAVAAAAVVHRRASLLHVGHLVGSVSAPPGRRSSESALVQA